MHLVDTHCHVDLYPDYEQVVWEISQGRVATIAVTNAPSVFRRSADLVGRGKYVRIALGFHPELVARRPEEIGMFTELSGETRFIGEVGLDFVTTDAEDKELQRKVFATILANCATHGNKILTIHSRRAARDVVDMIGSGFPGVIILHWYSGTIAVLERALTNGCYFSVNPAMTGTDAGRRIIRAIPPARLLTETDGPFVTVGSRIARPPDVRLVISYLAGIWKLSEQDVSDQVYANFRSILNEKRKTEHT